MSSRQAVYTAIDSERDYQDSRWSEEATGRNAIDRSLDEFILYIQQYAREAGALTTHGNEEEALRFVRKVAGLCVGCMEKHGAPQRTGFERLDTSQHQKPAFNPFEGTPFRAPPQDLSASETTSGAPSTEKMYAIPMTSMKSAVAFARACAEAPRGATVLLPQDLNPETVQSILEDPVHFLTVAENSGWLVS
ncbi:MAG: hypothetical protein AAF608_05150 [Pseudomonadota bacterium]